MNNTFHINQLVILSRPENTLHMKGALGCIVGLPNPERISPTCYEVDYPEWPHRHGHCRYWAEPRMLDPVDDDDHRTKAEEDKLIFNPNLMKVD